MLELGNICNNHNKEFYCYFILDGNKIICSYDAINELPNTFNGDNSFSFYLNQFMSIEYDSNSKKFLLCVNGPDGGIYYETKINLTINQCNKLLSFFKDLTDTYKYL